VAYRQIAPLEIKRETGSRRRFRNQKNQNLFRDPSSCGRIQNSSTNQFGSTFQNQTGSGEPQIPFQLMQVKSLELTLLRKYGIIYCRSEKNKNSAAQSFEGAEIRVLDEAI
jgi:hypothetical protein